MSERRSQGWLPEQLITVSVHYPARVLSAWALVLVGMTFGVLRLDIDTTTDSVLDTGAPAWSFYESSKKRFGGDEIIVVGLPASGSFEPSLLDEVERLTGELERLAGVRRVDSLASVPVIRIGTDGDLELSPAVSRGVPRADVKRLVENDRIAPRSLISDDGRVAALNVLIEADIEDYDGVVEAVRAATKARPSWISGVPVFRHAASARTAQEILLFVPLTVAAIALLVAGAYRSFRTTAIVLAVGGTGSWVMVGTMGFSGASLSLVTMILPSVLLALGCAYVMHVLSSGRDAADREALEEQLTKVGLPVALSSLTTAIGFSAIGTVPIDEVRLVGGFGALGAMVLGAATLTIGPALMSFWGAPRRAGRFSGAEEGLRNGLLRMAAERRKWVVAAWVALSIAVVVGITRVEVVTDATQWFPRGDEVRDSYDAIATHLSGISPVNVVIEGSEGRVTDPRPLEAIDRLTDHLEAFEQVGKALSIRDPLRQIHGAFVGDPTMPLPLEDNQAEQYLLLLESVDQIKDLVTDDRHAANVLLRVNDNGSRALLEIEQEATRWWVEHGPEEFQIRTTGIMYEFARAEDAIAYGQIRGVLLALAAVGATMLAALRSLRLALVAMIPNIIPTAMVFGLMGWLGIALDAGTIVVGSLALGVAIDDTIHIVGAFHQRLTAGASAEGALEGALKTVLHPVLLTTIAIAVGFGLLGFSGFTLTRNLGLLLAGVAGVCLLADLTLLPALLLALGRRGTLRGC